MTGEPVSRVISRMRELQDMGDWKAAAQTSSPRNTSQKHPGNSKPYNPEWKKEGTPSNSTERVSRREMFQALLKAGVSKESIDGKQTGELWKLYKQKVLSAKKVSTAPTAPGSRNREEGGED
ncbi:unnamed protein product [Ranitomeya imitator]|uniref:Uncharacterized protein n=1 Tax=Ranitomeya imitator TaxID=111125 RepID=A0ABN9M736_9NEOB|nr:unnamed protein product [Ranitomeya imitator]